MKTESSVNQIMSSTDGAGVKPPTGGSLSNVDGRKGVNYEPFAGIKFMVDGSTEGLSETSMSPNTPSVAKNPEEVNQDDHPMDSVLPGNKSLEVSVSENATGDSPPNEQDMNLPINDSLIIDNGDGDVSNTLDYLPSATSCQESSDDQKQALSKDLEEMGFEKMDLNKENDLENAADDPCSV